MLNSEVGTPTSVDGRRCILTREGASGHAVYGPYQQLDPGRYVVEFNIAAAAGEVAGSDDVCAVADVASRFGRLIFARSEIPASRLRDGPIAVPLIFEVESADLFEFRVGVTGRTPLLIDDYCVVAPLRQPDADAEQVLSETRFPDDRSMPKPAFFLQHLGALRTLYEGGAVVKVVGPDVVVSIAGVAFYARVSDDLRFVDEIFFRSAYNFVTEKPCCVIDVGTNIGLVALTFARKPFVREVHSFEPFVETYRRALDNFALNAEFSDKIMAHNFGLAGADDEATVLIQDESDSGAFSVRGSEEGTPKRIRVRDAATVLEPIIRAARASGRDVIAKVDCEGSEFPIFDSLERRGLLAEISAFMVEWHRGVDGKTQKDLFVPLLKNGFIVFDQSGKTGNGFFYAVRAGFADAAPTEEPDA